MGGDGYCDGLHLTDGEANLERLCDLHRPLSRAKLKLDPARLPYLKIRFAVSLTLWVPTVHAPSAYR